MSEPVAIGLIALAFLMVWIPLIALLIDHRNDVRERDPKRLKERVEALERDVHRIELILHEVITVVKSKIK